MLILLPLPDAGPIDGARERESPEICSKSSVGSLEELCRMATSRI